MHTVPSIDGTLTEEIVEAYEGIYAKLVENSQNDLGKVEGHANGTKAMEVGICYFGRLNSSKYDYNCSFFRINLPYFL